MNKTITFLAAAALAACALAGYAADITGRVTDGAGEPLMQASVRLLKPDSAFVAGTAADLDGRFSLPAVKPGRYLLETTYVGFAPVTMPVEVGKANLSMKPIVMSESSKSLAEVTVTAVKTPVKVMTDTVEFNADSYLTRPNAVVEDLLKRLPGVEISSDGKITANGKEVTKILVDGKEFFSDDPKVASKNLPAEMVNKLQVIDRKSDLARLTGVDDGEDETVINLSVKPNMRNGWFGTVEGGYGTDSRYKGNFNVSRFQNGNQLTLLGNFNNINELGFTDGNGNRFHRFGGNHGVTSSNSVGLNFSVGNEEKFRIGGNVMYSNTDTKSITASERQYLFPDSTSYYSSDSNSRDKGNNVRGDFRLLWKPDSLNTIEFRPNFSFNFNRSTSASSSTTSAGDAQHTLVNRTRNDVSSRGDSYEFGGRLIYTHNFASRRGRSFSVMLNYRGSNVREKENSASFNEFFLVDNQDEDYLQYTDNHSWNNRVGARLTWKEPLGDVARGNFLTFSYQLNYRWNNTDKLVYDREFDDDGNIVGETYNPELSNRFRNNFISHNIRVGYQKVTAKTNAEVGVSLVPSSSMSTNLTNADKTIPRRNVFNFSPFLRYRYKMSKTRSIQARYNGRASEPSLSQLQPVADVSDPLRIVVGNPDLSPTFTHFLMFRFQDFNTDAQRSMMAMAHFNIVQNSIVQKTTYNSETGGQTTTYDNVNGVWNGHAMFMMSFPFRNKYWTFNNHIFTHLEHNVGFNNGLRTTTFNVGITEEPGIAFRPSNLELELRPRYALHTSTTSVETNVGRTVHNFGGSFYATYYLPFGLSISTDLRYDATRGYSAGYNSDVWMWNAQLSYQFLRNQAATISLKVYDILGQTKNINRNVTASYIEDMRYNSLTRYGMVTFSYRFNTFGKGKQPADSGDFMHPGRPMGPPPGMHRH